MVVVIVDNDVVSRMRGGSVAVVACKMTSHPTAVRCVAVDSKQ